MRYGQGAPGHPESPPRPVTSTCKALGRCALLGPGPTALSAAYRGNGEPTDLDAVLLEPEVERLLLTGRGKTQALLRTSASMVQYVRLRVGRGRMRAFTYDARGRLRGRPDGSGGWITTLVWPGGFTDLLGARRAG